MLALLGACCPLSHPAVCSCMLGAAATAAGLCVSPCLRACACVRVCRLQQAVARASKKIQQGSDKMALASSLKMVSAGVEMVFGSAAAISAAFGYTDRVGLDVELLEQTQQSILQLFSAEE